MILALTSEEGQLTTKGKGRKNEHDSDTDIETDDDIVEVKDDSVGWAYVGSHNFTPSAWGNLSGSSFNPVLNVRIYQIQLVARTNFLTNLIYKRSQTTSWALFSRSKN